MNKVIKSMVAIVLAVTMMFSGAVSAFAAETANVVLATNKEKYAIGETVEVTVSSDVKFNTYEAYFQYDKEALKFDTIVGTSTYNEDMATNANAEDVFGGGVVFTVYFTAQKAGEYTVALDESASYFSYGIDITDYDVTYTTATVVVEGKEEPAPHEHIEEIIPAVPATCSATGLTEGKKCSVCDEVIVAQKEIAKLAHTEEVVAGKEATCTETGLTEGKKCSVCGEVTVAQKEIAKLAHNYVDGKCECGDTLPAIEIDDTTYWMDKAGNLYAANGVKVGSVSEDEDEAVVNGVPYEKDANGVWVEKVEEKPAVSTKKYYTVKVEAGLNGKISPEGSFEVREGKDKTFKITANEGFVIDVLTVDRKEVSKAAGKETYTLTLEDIDENYNIKVTFVKEVAPVVDDKANPSTGSNEFVGAAVALAVVSVMGAAVISKK